MSRTQVLLDSQGRSIRPALLWRDHRAVEDAASLAGQIPLPNPATSINAFHPLARLAWIARMEPAHFERLKLVLEPKDFLNLRLTGVTATDSVTAARLDDLALAPPDLLATLQRGLSLLEHPRVPPWARIGEITAVHAPFDELRGIPVFAGAMDTWAGAVGSGVSSAGRAYDVAGTSEAVGLVSPWNVSVPGLVTLPWAENLFQIGGPTQAGGDAARWAFETFRVAGRFEQAMEHAGRLAPTAELPVFLPYLAGERAPVWRPEIRGVFDGLSRHHDGRAFLFSTLEGVAFAVKDILLAAANGAGTDVEEVHISGGGARSDAWCQLKANVLGVPVARPSEVETGLIGCAITCAVGLGIHGSLHGAADAMSPMERTFEPDPSLVPLFASRFERYQDLKARALGPASIPLRHDARGDLGKP
jgi:xylulokinase